MSSIKTYIAAQNESTSSWVDRATIIGFDIAYCAYGVHATLCFICLSYFWAQRRNRPRQSYAWMMYISMIFILGSIANAMDMRMSQVIFVDNRNFPGGPGAYATTTFTVPVNIVCTAACVIGGWFMDALLIFRFYVIVAPPEWFLFVPLFLFIASVGQSRLFNSLLRLTGLKGLQSNVVSLTRTAHPSREYNMAAHDIALNIMLTLLIVGHLLRVRHKVLKTTQVQVPYLTVSAMLIEAAFLYTAFALAFLIPYAMGNPVNILFFSLLGQVQYITPLLIILRVAQGRAYPRQTSQATVSSLRWAGQFTETPVDVRPPDTSTNSPGELTFRSRKNSSHVSESEKVTTFFAFAHDQNSSRFSLPSDGNINDVENV
ncbi:hypothetical protein EIP91_010372 [Steccherinum ochraceum]|uniref:Uncharacterized protein n=1 Tax=Steccherinum ochraceum TaxID=92696 RepID=A0A4R0RNE7_9APHY|nr:hypothetical protein EIP91_010372 [Steccherinum ochraceum]